MCEECALGKIQQMKTKNTKIVRSTNPGEHIFIDIAHIQGLSLGVAQYWNLIFDDYTRYKWGLYLKKKSDLPSSMIIFLTKPRNMGKLVRIIQCDNSGENVALHDLCIEKKCIQFEFTSPGTPQHNGVVEREFPTVFGKIRATLNTAGISGSMRTST